MYSILWIYTEIGQHQLNFVHLGKNQYKKILQKRKIDLVASRAKIGEEFLLDFRFSEKKGANWLLF